MSAPSQRSFAGGELSPAVYARTDQVKYATGLRTCRNFVVQRHGGVQSRAGTKFIGAVKDASKTVRLVKFVLDGTDIDDTYVMEFGDGYLRFFQDSGRVVVSSVAAWANAATYAVGNLVSRAGVNYYCISAHVAATATDGPGTGSAWQTRWSALTGTTYEIPTPYAEGDLSTLKFSQTGDIITIAHPGYAPRELRRYGHTNWILSAIAFGPSLSAPTNIAATSAGAAGTVYYAVTSVKEGTLEESLAGLYTFGKVPTSGNPATLTWNPAANAISYNVYRGTDGTTYGLLSSSGGLPGIASDTSWGTSNTNVTGTSSSVYATGAPLANVLSVSATARAYDGVYTVRFAVTVTGAAGAIGAGVGRYLIYYSRDSETPVLAKTSDIIIVDGEGTVGPTAVSEPILVPDNGYTALTITVVPQALACLGGGNVDTTLDATGAPSNQVSWTGQVAGFVDNGATPDYSIAPPTNPSLFDTPTRRPAAVGVYQQRRMFGSTTEAPEQVWASRIGSYSSFTRSTPLQDDDAISFALAGNRVNAVKHLLDLARLLVFTTGSVLAVDGNQAGTLTPDSINPRKVARQGIGNLFPLEVDDSAIYVQARGSIVRSLTPVEAGGAFGGYRGSNLSVFSNHLFDGYTIVDWDYAEEPGGVVWAVRSDGTLLGLTNLPEHAVWGWHRHDTDGVIENVCTVPEGAEDALYLVVRRTVNGATVRYVERMQTRFFTDIRSLCLMDCALSYDGRNTSTATMRLTGSSSWASTEAVTVTCVGATPFAATNVGDSVVFTAADGSRVEVKLEGFTSSTVMTGRPTRTVPVELQSTATTTWTLAVAKVGGLSHLEGKAVSVLGDGFVDASPNNPEYATRRVVSGQVTLGRAYGQITVGLPFTADLETLDLDSPGPRTIKDKKMLVTKVGLFVQSSRGIWTGRPDKPTAALPLNGLQEFKSRSTEDYDSPPTLQTDYLEITIDNAWNTNGRILVRQVDPLPLTVLSWTPIGYIGA